MGNLIRLHVKYAIQRFKRLSAARNANAVCLIPVNINKSKGELLMIHVIQEILEEMRKRSVKDGRECYSEIVNDLTIVVEEKLQKYEADVEKKIGDLIEMFLSDKKLAGCSAGTISNYRLELNKFKQYVTKAIDELTAHDIKHYLSGFEHLKKSTLATKISTIKSFFSFLFDEEIIEKNPMRKIKRVKEEKNQPKYLNMDELLRLREACGSDIRKRAILEFLFESGCRISEIVGININDIDWSNRSVVVKGKGSKERTVYFHTNTFFFLKRYLAEREDNCPALFVTKIGEAKRIHPRSIQLELKQLGKLSGIEKRLHPHVLRHSFATHLLNRGMDIATVSELLGHEKLSTTQIYARVTEQKKKQDYNRYIA